VISTLPPASWETTLRGRLAPCAGGRRLPLRPITRDEYEDAADEQGFLPAPLGRGLDGRYYWWYDNAFHRAPVDMEPEEVAAKVHALARDRRTRSEAARIKALRVLVEQRDNGACVACGTTEDVHVEMAVPPSLGGGMTFENLHMLCPACAAELARRQNLRRAV
jgi:hypothetical protein